MKFSRILILATTTTPLVFGKQSVFNFNDWSKDDLVDYLLDNSPVSLNTNNDPQYNLKYLTSKSIDELKRDAQSYWNQYNKSLDTKKRQWWDLWSKVSDCYHYYWQSCGGNGSNKQNFHATNYFPTFSNENSVSNSVSDWLFGTWSTDTLIEFLKSNGIDIHGVEDKNIDIHNSKDKLINLIRKNFHTLSTKMGKSGLYPSKDYFKNWSKNDLVLWLDRFKVSYDRESIKDDKDKLLNLVRQNIYKMSDLLQDERIRLLTGLQLFNKQLYDKNGNLKPNVFDSWNTQHLEKWLQSHEIPVQENLVNSREYLVQLANKNRDLLMDDINWYLSVSKQKIGSSNPFLKKTPAYVSSLWNVSKNYFQSLYGKCQNKSSDIINDTFLVGIDNWSKDRLKKFLDLRDIKYPYFATKQELINLAVENRNKPLKKLLKKWQQTMHTLNKDVQGVKDWSVENKNDFMESETYENLLNNLAILNQQRKDWQQSMKQNLDAWSTDDLKEYIKQFGVKLDEKMYSKDELIELAKENTQWFLGIPKNEPFYKKGYKKLATTFTRWKKLYLG
ncbi:double-strand break repair enhancer MSC1 PWA37_001380 [Arxiozyma heterogenica]|uniref:double-strand break repair enhancer MSC1 n=1 Tax=Arxiozyma heterogenica TaxID=278026 RepID=UPI002EF5D48F